MDAEKKNEKKRNHGARNLMIMGVVAILVAISTTGISLAIYHNSGDIYLDRSRPGFLPDESEIEESNDDENEYDFLVNGEVTPEGLNEYLKNLEQEEMQINVYEKPFDGRVLSDENLGIIEDKNE